MRYPSICLADVGRRLPGNCQQTARLGFLKSRFCTVDIEGNGGGDDGD